MGEEGEGRRRRAILGGRNDKIFRGSTRLSPRLFFLSSEDASSSPSAPACTSLYTQAAVCGGSLSVRSADLKDPTRAWGSSVMDNQFGKEALQNSSSSSSSFLRFLFSFQAGVVKKDRTLALRSQSCLFVSEESVPVVTDERRSCLERRDGGSMQIDIYPTARSVLTCKRGGRETERQNRTTRSKVTHTKAKLHVYDV